MQFTSLLLRRADLYGA